MKKVLAMILALIMILSLAACGAKTEEPAAQTAAPEAAEAAKTEDKTESPGDEKPFAGQTLKVSAFANPANAGAWTEIVEAFEAMYGCTVELTVDAKIADVVQPQIAAGNYPDVYVHSSAGNAVFTALDKEDMLVDLTDVFEQPGIDDETVLKDQIATGVLESSFCNTKRDGKIYAAPYAFKQKGLGYNAALLEKYGWELPTTWDEAMELGEKAKAEGIALFTYQGIYPDYNGNIFFCTLASALGTDKVTELSNFGEGIITSEAALKALGYYEQMAKNGYILEGTTGMDHTQSQTEFLQGKALFIPAGDWFPAEMADVAPCEDFAWGLTAGFAIEEGQERYLTPSPTGVCVPTEAENIPLAKEFIRFIYTDEAVKMFAKYQFCGATKDAMELGKEFFTEDFMTMRQADAQFENYIFAFKTVPATSRIVIGDTVWNPISDIVNGTMTTEEWAQGIEDAIEAINRGE